MRTDIIKAAGMGRQVNSIGQTAIKFKNKRAYGQTPFGAFSIATKIKEDICVGHDAFCKTVDAVKSFDAYKISKTQLIVKDGNKTIRLKLINKATDYSIPPPKNTKRHVIDDEQWQLLKSCHTFSSFDRESTWTAGLRIEKGCGTITNGHFLFRWKDSLPFIKEQAFTIPYDVLKSIKSIKETPDCFCVDERAIYFLFGEDFISFQLLDVEYPADQVDGVLKKNFNINVTDEQILTVDKLPLDEMDKMKKLANLQMNSPLILEGSAISYKGSDFEGIDASYNIDNFNLPFTRKINGAYLQTIFKFGCNIYINENETMLSFAGGSDLHGLLCYIRT